MTLLPVTSVKVTEPLPSAVSNLPPKPLTWPIFCSMKKRRSVLKGVIYALAAESTIQLLLMDVDVISEVLAMNRVIFAIRFNVLAE